VTPRILALDLSLTQTGWAIEGDSGVIRSRLRGWERIDRIRREVMALAAFADLVCIEGYSYGSKGMAVYQIAELGGIIRYSLWMRHILYVEVSPSTLKKFATTKGNCGKDEMIAAAIRKYGFEGCNNNEADAWLLWHMASVHYHGVEKITKVELEQVRKIDWPQVGDRA
jgi:crossover junction endodeoxyribonuclease RuvC